MKPRKRIVGFAIRAGGKPVELAGFSLHKKGLLIPSSSTTTFIVQRGGERRPKWAKRRAEKIINRTLTVAQELSQSLLYDNPTVKKIREAGPYELEALLA